MGGPVSRQVMFIVMVTCVVGLAMAGIVGAMMH